MTLIKTILLIIFIGMTLSKIRTGKFGFFFFVILAVSSTIIITCLLVINLAISIITRAESEHFGYSIMNKTMAYSRLGMKKIMDLEK
jgi:hypothetical protein